MKRDSRGVRMAESVVLSIFRRPEMTAREAPPQPTERAAPPVPEALVPPTVPNGATKAVSTVPGPAPAATTWADLSAIPVSSDQLGLAHPAIISLSARLPGAPVIVLDAEMSGIYQPAGSHSVSKRGL